MTGNLKKDHVGNLVVDDRLSSKCRLIFKPNLNWGLFDEIQIQKDEIIPNKTIGLVSYLDSTLDLKIGDIICFTNRDFRILSRDWENDYDLVYGGYELNGSAKVMERYSRGRGIDYHLYYLGKDLQGFTLD